MTHLITSVPPSRIQVSSTTPAPGLVTLTLDGGRIIIEQATPADAMLAVIALAHDRRCPVDVEVDGTWVRIGADGRLTSGLTDREEVSSDQVPIGAAAACSSPAHAVENVDEPASSPPPCLPRTRRRRRLRAEPSTEEPVPTPPPALVHRPAWPRARAVTVTTAACVALLALEIGAGTWVYRNVLAPAPAPAHPRPASGATPATEHSPAATPTQAETTVASEPPVPTDIPVADDARSGSTPTESPAPAPAETSKTPALPADTTAAPARSTPGISEPTPAQPPVPAPVPDPAPSPTVPAAQITSIRASVTSGTGEATITVTVRTSGPLEVAPTAQIAGTPVTFTSQAVDGDGTFTGTATGLPAGTRPWDVTAGTLSTTGTIEIF